MQARQRGAAIVEFALVLPLLLLLGMITTEFGRAMYQYNSIVKSLRDATRYLAMQTPDTKITEAKNLVVYGKTNPTLTDTALVPGLTVSNVAAPSWQLTGSAPVMKTVTITVRGYTFHPMFTGAFGVTFGDITYGDISASMRSPL